MFYEEEIELPDGFSTDDNNGFDDDFRTISNDSDEDKSNWNYEE